ncbi:hypothetical protein AN478_09670 [Thiohalorhabdus denitrificans]|uniref:Uncharacterized protein n=1 Tax=Thiohalorhabdus denitrificans TaxID=381306 RepID=A0A0P9C3W0_9GAMM|nr:hypothetical protein [Thiohalorhabdus denitrificans]KPV39434.1 hypothetical protein AN478_09670 [Thiohalorhabdus denitrificans]SCY03281.1 hypothetical protein SAMN05661077_1105 [Thiohalorhabdus denitrificans]
MGRTGPAGILLLALAATGCDLEPGSFQAFAVEGDGEGTGLSAADGIWRGTLTQDEGLAGESVTAVVWDGEVRMMAPGPDAGFAGSLARRDTATREETSGEASAEGDSILDPGFTLDPGPTSEDPLTRDTRFTTETSFSRPVEPVGDTFSTEAETAASTVAAEGPVRSYDLSGGTAGTGRMAVTIDPETSMRGTVSGTREDGELDLAFSDRFRQEVVLSDLTGSWSVTRNNRTLTITVDGLGGLEGSDTEGCVLNGGLELLQRGHNLFAVDLSLENCPGDSGDYTGFAFLDAEVAGAASGLDELWLLAEGERRDGFLGMVLVRQ